MKQSVKLSRTAISIGEVLFVIAAGLVIPLSPATPAAATVASPALISTTAAPTGVLANSPWIADSAGTEWSYGTTTASVGTLLSRNRASGVISPSTVAGGDEGSIAALYSPLTNIAVFSVRRAGSGNRIVTFDLSTGTRLMMRAMATDENNIRALAFNTAAKSVIVGTNTIPAKLIKIDASSGNQQGSVTLASSLKDITALIPSGTDVLAVTNSTPVKIIPMDRSSMTLGTAVALTSTTPMLVDPVVVGTTAYLGTDATPGRITAIDIPTKTVINSVTFATDEIGARNLAVDESTGTLYATTTTANGPRLVSFALATLNRQGFTELGAGSEATSMLFHDHELSVGFSGTRGIGRMTVAPEPASPTTVAITPGDKSLTLSWSAPASIEPILGYTVTATKGTESATCSATTTSCTISGLRNGDVYSVSVVARSIAGASSPTVVTGTPRTVPNAPTIVDVSRGNGSLTATWTSAGDGGSAIVEYTATAYPSGRSCTSIQTACTISGLTNGVPQTIRVKARNIAGTSLDSTTSKSVAPATVPQSVAGVTVTRGDRGASVSWNPPASDGGDPITSYRVIVRLDGRVTNEISATETSATITGLTNGSRYDVTVSAINAVGAGDESTYVAVTPATTPDSPRNVQATRDSGGATIDWVVPASDGGSTVISYRIQVWDSSNLAVDTTSTTTTISVSGLTNGKTYRVAVSALNSVGASVASAPTYVTPATTPSAPREISGTRGDSHAVISWGSPSSDGGDVIIDYVVRVTGGGQPPREIATRDPVADLTGLSNGTNYSFSVWARNSVGSSTQSAQVAVTPATTPRAPRSVAAERQNGGISVTWVAPENDGGDPLTPYVVRVWRDADLVSSTTTSNTTATIAGLTNGVRYRVTVTASNTVGDSDPSPASDVTPATTPSSPENVRATRGNGATSVEWNAPHSDGGDPVTAYRIQVWDSNNLTADMTSTTTSIRVDGLTNGKTYRVSVSALNSVGVSVASDAIYVTPATTPSSPRKISGTRGDSHAVISWAAPSSDGGDAIIDYLVRVTGGGQPPREIVTHDPIADITGLSNGTNYSFNVTARNSVGASVESVSVSVTPATTPSAPRKVTTERHDGGISVAWDAPESDGGDPLAPYIVRVWRDTDLVNSVTTSNASATIAGLTNGVRYRVTVTASNTVGTSDPSPASFVTPASTPGTPENVRAIRGNGAATIEWDPPQSNGGDPVDLYHVRMWDSNDLAVNATSTTTSIPVSGLTNGKTYGVSVTALNTVGESARSDLTYVTPATTPGAPVNVTTQRRDGSVFVAWDAPESDGGDPLDSYRVRVWSGDNEISEIAVHDEFVVASGLTNGTNYRFEIAAVNSVGQGPWSSSVDATPATVPGIAESIVAEAGDGDVNLEWAAPHDDGGDSITHYRIRLLADSSMVSQMDVTGGSTRIEGLTNGVAYQITVSAVNSVGEGNPSTAVRVVPVSPPVIEQPVVDPPSVAPEEPHIPAVIPDTPVVDPINPETPVTIPDPPVVITDPPMVNPIDPEPPTSVPDPPVVIPDPPAVIPNPPAVIPDPPIAIPDPPFVIDPEIPGPPIDEPGSPTVIHTPVPPSEIKILMRSRKRIVIGWENTSQADAPVLRYVVQTSRRKSAGFVSLCDLDWSSSQIELPRPRMGGLYVRIISVNDAGESEPSPIKKVF